MALTRLDNLISSKTGKYLYVSPDDFNASDELNNRGNSPVRPFKSIQRAFLEIARYSYLPGKDNDRFDQFTIMLMPGNHYIDNRPGLVGTDGIDTFAFNQALGEWEDSSNLDIGDPNNVLYKFNNTEGGAIIPRGSSLVGYDLRRTAVYPLFVPDPADNLETRSAIFNVTGGCYFWQFTIRDGDLQPSSPLYDTNDGIGKVYNQNGKWSELKVPNYSHHKLTVFEYADKEELSLYYRKVAKAFAQYQPTIDNPDEFSDRIQETRIVGPLSDIRSIESIKLDDSSTIATLPGSVTEVTVTTKVDHGYFKNQFIAIENNGIDDAINGTFAISEIDNSDPRVFRYRIDGTVTSLGNGLTSGTTLTVTSASNPLGTNAAVKAEVDSVESASPYVFNCSIRSTWGICGIWANGLKATGFKSMVIAQYTGVSLQKDDRAFIRYDEYTNTFNQASLTDAFATVPYHTKGDAYWKDDWRNFHVRASEDAFIQCVSIFAVGYADHFLMESGGDMSITNSNSNFGNTSLHAKGHKGYAFNQDKGGYIDAIIPPEEVSDSPEFIKRNSYYTLDIQASNDPQNHTAIYLGDDEGYDPNDRPAATIGGYTIGAKSDEQLFVKLTPGPGLNDSIHKATLNPTGFQRFAASPKILNPGGTVVVSNKDQDAANRIEDNKEFIAHEAYGYITSKYPSLLIKNGITIEKCRRDIGYLLDATIQDLRLGGNINTIQAGESYYVQSQLSYITGELTETLEGYDYARDLAIAALRNFTYKRTNVETTANSSLINVSDSSGIVPGMLVADYDPADFEANELKSTATPNNTVIPAGTYVKRIVDSSTIEIGQQATAEEKKVVGDRFGDAGNQLLTNKVFIAAEAFDRMVLDYPGYTSPTGYTAQDCRDDLVDIVEAIAENTKYGGNHEVWDAADHYDSGRVAYIAQKRPETLRAIEYAKDMAVQIMRSEDVFVYGSHGLIQNKDATITQEAPELVNDRNGDARNLILANKEIIAHEAVERMVLSSSTEQFTPTGAVYNATTGELELTIVGHGLDAADVHTIGGAAFNATSGKMTVTMNAHGFAAGEKVKFDDDSITLTCDMDNNATQHTYPRATDPVSGKWLEISNVTTNTFDVHVGESPTISFTPTAADYNPTTGLMTLTIGNHGLTAGTSIKLLEESLKFSCGFGGATGTAAEKSYPRSTDPFHDTSIQIESVTADTITIQVLATQPSTNTDPHTFVSALAGAVITGGDYTHTFVTAAAQGMKRAADQVRLDYGSINFKCDMDGQSTTHAYPRVSDPAATALLPVSAKTADTITINVGKTININHDVSAAQYDPNTGDMELTIGSHNLRTGSSVRLADQSLVFKCAKDNFNAATSYPRSTDPGYQTALKIKKVGASYHTAEGGDYDPATGILELNVPGHGFVNGDRIKISDGGLTFTCAMDGNASEHSYPRPSDPVSGDWLTVSDVTVDTFKVNVEAAGANESFTPSNAAYDPASGHLTLTFASTVGWGMGTSLVIDDNALSFTCTMDGNQVPQTYPRPNVDKAAGRSLPIIGGDGQHTVIVDVGMAGDNKYFQPTSADYNYMTGDMTLTLGQHGLAVGSDITLKDNALTFTCDKDGNVSNHSYPRPGVDPYAGKSISITEVGQSEHTATDVVYDSSTGDLTVTVPSHGFAGPQEFTPIVGQTAYDPATGVLTLNIPNHGLSDGEYIRIKDNSLKFTCDKDNNVSEHTYPRPTDPVSNKDLVISNATQSTFTVQVGAAASADQYPHTFVSAVTGAVTNGGDHIQIADGSLTLACSLGGAGVHTWVGGTATNAFNSNKSVTDADYDPATGVMVITSAAHGLQAPSSVTVTNASYTASTGVMTLTVANHGFSNGDKVKLADNSISMKCAMDGNSATKSYPRPSDPISGKWITISNVQTDTFDINVGASPLVQHTPTDGSYDPSTGLMTLTIGAHNLTPDTSVKISNGSLSFQCDKDNFATDHLYPRATDPSYDTAVNITSVTATTITLNVGTTTDDSLHRWKPGFAASNAITSGGDHAHIFASATPNGLQKSNSTVTFNPNALSFTCDKDNNATVHTYPRTTDPAHATPLEVWAVTNDTITINVGKASAGSAYPRAGFDYPSGKWLQIREATANTFRVNVGLSSHIGNHVFISAAKNGIKKQTGTVTINVGTPTITNYTPSNAAYDPATGVMEITIGSHSLQVGDSIQITEGGLSFTCAKDGNTTLHPYPRTTDPFYQKYIDIISTTGTTITVNVGPANDNTVGAHAFVSALPNAITTGHQFKHTFVSAISNAVEYLPLSAHTFVSAANLCVHQKPATAHTFKRGAIGAIQRQSGTITINVGAATPGDRYQHQFISATAGAVTSGGNYTHAWVSSASNSVHKVFSVGGSRAYHNVDCVDDVRDVLEAIADNVAYGGNDKTYDAAYSFKTGAHVAGEELETNVVFEHARDMAVQVMRDQNILPIGSHGLTQTRDTSITKDTTRNATPHGRFGDARDLILSNADLISHEAYDRMILQNPGFVPPTGNPQDCRDDIKDFITEISYNLAFGGNDRVYDMANLYVTGAHVAGEEEQTLMAFEDAKELMVQVMRNEKVLIIGSHGKTQTYDTTITTSTSTPQNNKAADAKNLILANKNFIAEIALGRMLAQYTNYVPAAGYTTADCLDDLKDVVEVVAHNVAFGGNDRVWDTGNLYVSGGHANGHENETIFGFNAVRDIIIEVIRNEAVTVGGHTQLTQSMYTGTVDTANPKCQNETSAVTTLIQILTDTIATPTSLHSVTRTVSAEKCEDVRSAINTLTAIATNAITDPSSLAGVNRTVTNANYNPVTGDMVLTIGNHGFTTSDVVNIAPNSLSFTCAKDSDNTIHTYPRATDPSYNSYNAITAVTADTITINVLSSAPSTNTSTHTFVSADVGALQVGGIIRTPSVGRCEDIRATVNSLFKILTDTISDSSSLDDVSRTISNGPCQTVASAITTLFGIITSTISNTGYLDTIERIESPKGISFGPSVNANTSTTSTILWFSWPTVAGMGGSGAAERGVYTDLRPNIDPSFSASSANAARREESYPECATQATAVRQFFTNISTIIQNGLGSVPRNEPAQSTAALSTRATVWSLRDPNQAPPSQGNPHKLETGTPVRLVPRPRFDTVTQKYVDVDKRNVRLPNGFSPNEIYYVIAPGRFTQPKDYSTTTSFDGSDQSQLMLANSVENAAAGIYIHSAEVEAIDRDVEIDIYQFTLDNVYDLIKYKCSIDTGVGAVPGGLKTDVSHIFDKPDSGVPDGHPIFFRANSGDLPKVGGNFASDPDVADANNRIRGDVVFWARYVSPKVFKLYKTFNNALGDNQPIIITEDKDYSVYCNKRTSPLKFDPTYDNTPTATQKGKWYLQVKDTSTPGTQDYDVQSILKRFHDTDYNDASGKDKSNDSYYTRIEDERDPNDRIYRLRYVIPKYLKSVRDPLNGFTIKMRKDETRKLPSQKIILKKISGSVSEAKFYNNVSGSTQTNEIIGWTASQFKNASPECKIEDAYDPYKKDLTGSGLVYKKVITTQNYVDFTIQSGRYFVDSATGDTQLELSVFDLGISNNALKNETFVTVQVTVPQGGSFTKNPNMPGGTYDQASKVEWNDPGTGAGFAYIHAALPTNPNDPNNTTWHLVLKGVSGKIEYSSNDSIRLSQGAVFADLLSDPDFGKSLVLKDLIKKGYPENYYRQNGAAVYTLTPGDIVEDDDGVQFYIDSVKDGGEIDDTFYIFDVQEIQKRIFEQQDGIFYLTAVRGNISPYPTGAGNLGNFRNFKFSQPVSKLYPLNYKNDPVWYKQLDSNLVDPPITYSAADNYIHGLVTVNDFKNSLTREGIEDLVQTPALSSFNFKDVNQNSIIKAKKGNATSGSEDRQIPIAGDSTVVVDQRLYVELRRPSIARAGNHTFEYLGFGPGNYSTALPIRQEVLLSPIQDFYAQSKKENGGLVFYTGLNSNGDLYIGNRKIDAITGEEEFLERATLVDSFTPDDPIDNLVTTFDTPVTFNENITVNGGDDGKKTNNFNSPVQISVEPNLGLQSLTILSTVDTSLGEDALLGRDNQQGNQATRGDIVLNKNMVAASVFQFNPRGSGGIAQGYKIQNHAVGGVGSNITPDQDGTFGTDQIVRYGSQGPLPKTGDILLKGKSVGASGSVSWILANSFNDISSQVQHLDLNGTQVIRLKWKNSVANNAFVPPITAASMIKIDGLSDNAVNGRWPINSGTFAGGNDYVDITITANRGNIGNDDPRLWSSEPNATLSYSDSTWKEVGVLGAESIRTDTDVWGDFKVGINTIQRAGGDAWKNAFVDNSTDPRANLDVIGTTWISGKTSPNWTTTYKAGTAHVLTEQDHAFMVGGDSATPDNIATFRVATTNSGMVGINTAGPSVSIPGVTNITNDVLDSTLTVVGTGRFTDDVKFEQDVTIGWWPDAYDNGTVNVSTGITTGTFNFLMGTQFKGTQSTTTGGSKGLLIAGSAQNIELGNVQTDAQDIKIGNQSSSSIINLGATPDGPSPYINKSRIKIGGAFLSTETDSYTEIGTKSFGIAGDVRLGFRRSGAGSITKFESNSETVEFLSGNSATSIVKFAENSSDVTIAGQGGKTNIRNNLVVDASARFNSDMILCGGSSSYTFTGYRAQGGSTIMSHNQQGGLSPTRNVDFIDVLRFPSTTVTGEYNAVNTESNDPWGGAEYQNPRTNVTPNLPALSGLEYYLPIDKSPYDAAGNLYYGINDILIIDSDGSGEYAEFVKIKSLVRVNQAPYYIIVERQPFGTMTTIGDFHDEDTAIFKCQVQYQSTWITADIDNSGAEDDVYLSQFGGSLEVGDYVMIDRDATGATGEIIEVKTLINQVPKKLTVKKGCDTTAEEVMFEVDSTNGNLYIGGDIITDGSLTINGSCAAPYTNSDTNQKLTITNGDGIETFEVDTCTGDTVVGNTHGTVFVTAEAFGTSPAAYTTSDIVHVYRKDPQAKAAGGPSTTVADPITAVTSDIKIASNIGGFVVGDLVMISNASNVEIIQITQAPYTDSNGNLILPTQTNATYPLGGRGKEDTVATTFSTGDDVVKINKFDRTTTLLHTIPATRTDRSSGLTSIKARQPNTSDLRYEIQLKDSDLISNKQDYEQYIRIGTEWFHPDSIDGSTDTAYGVKLVKSIRETNNDVTKLFGGGHLTTNDDVEIYSGNFRMYGSDRQTVVLSIANDDEHSGDGSLLDPKTGTNGLTLKGNGNFFGDLYTYQESCQINNVCSNVRTFRVAGLSGSVEMGETFYQKGKVFPAESGTESIFHIDNLGSAGVGGTAGAKDFKIYQDNAIDSFGIEKYWTANGGRRFTYVEFDIAGVGQTQTTPLQVNNNYLINAASGNNMVLYLPDNAQTGDMIRFIELSGNLTYNTSLIIRALKINNLPVSIQGDSSGTSIAAGAGGTIPQWDSGELIIQTRNASFGLVYAGDTDLANSANAQTIPPALRGWWLMEL